MSEGRDSALRLAVLVLFALGAAGTVVELLLIGHVEDGWQVAPVWLLGACVALAVWAGISRGATPVRLCRIAALLLVAIGTLGLFLHWRANSEFEREVSPSLTGAAFVWKALRGASPPSAAPATLIHLGLLGLVYTWRHPGAQGAPAGRGTRSVNDR